MVLPDVWIATEYDNWWSMSGPGGESKTIISNIVVNAELPEAIFKVPEGAEGAEGK